MKGNIIKLSINNDKKYFEIYIDESRITFTNKDFDVTFIEIKENDVIDEDSFLDLDNQLYKSEDNDIFKNLPIYLLHYPKGTEINKSSGLIRRINDDNYTIEHVCDSSSGSSGGPIFNLKDLKVLGVHKGAAKEGKNGI